MAAAYHPNSWTSTSRRAERQLHHLQPPPLCFGLRLNSTWVAKTVSRSALVAYAMVPVLFVISMAMISWIGSPLSIVSLLVIGSLLGIASIGQTLTIVLGGIDLSIPAVIGLANVLTVRW